MRMLLCLCLKISRYSWFVLVVRRIVRRAFFTYEHQQYDSILVYSR